MRKEVAEVEREICAENGGLAELAIREKDVIIDVDTAGVWGKQAVRTCTDNSCCL